MKFKLFDSVVLTRDLPEHGLHDGDLGAVVYIHEPDALEVEFFNASGETQAVISVHDSDLRPAEQNDLESMRRILRSA